MKSIVEFLNKEDNDVAKYAYKIVNGNEEGRIKVRAIQEARNKTPENEEVVYHCSGLDYYGNECNAIMKLVSIESSAIKPYFKEDARFGTHIKNCDEAKPAKGNIVIRIDHDVSQVDLLAYYNKQMARKEKTEEEKKESPSAEHEDKSRDKSDEDDDEDKDDLVAMIKPRCLNHFWILLNNLGSDQVLAGGVLCRMAVINKHTKDFYRPRGDNVMGGCMLVQAQLCSDPEKRTLGIEEAKRSKEFRYVLEEIYETNKKVYYLLVFPNNFKLLEMATKKIFNNIKNGERNALILCSDWSYDEAATELYGHIVYKGTINKLSQLELVK